MRKSALYLLAALFLLVISACSNDPGTKITVSFDDVGGQAAFPTAVAYQIGDGEWSNLSPDSEGGYTFYVPSGETRYGVAVRCNGLLGSSSQFGAVYQLTTAESASPTLPCPGTSAIATITGTADVSALASSASFAVYSNTASKMYDMKTKGEYRINVPENEKASVVLLAYDDSFSHGFFDLIGGRVFHDINATGVTSEDLTLKATDTIGKKLLGPFELPPGFTYGGYSASLLTAGGAWAFGLGRGDNTGGVFKTIEGTRSGDFYALIASAPDGARSLNWQLLVDATEVKNATAKLTMVPFPSGYSVTAASRPVFALDGSNDGLDFHALTITSSRIYWQYMFSKGWQGDLASYQPPDLDGLIGFEGSTPRSGEQLTWYLTSCRGDADPGDYFEAVHSMATSELMTALVPGELQSAEVTGTITVP